MTNRTPTLAVELPQVRELLQRYIRALSGRDVLALAAADAPYDPQSCLAVMVEETAELVLRFPESAPFARFKRLAAHQAGHLESGSRDLDLGRTSALFANLRPRLLPTMRDTGSPLAALVGAFPDAPLAARLFDLLEDFRVDAALLRRYRGLRPDFRGRERAIAAADTADLGLLPLRRLVLGAMRRYVDGERLRLAVPERFSDAVALVAGLFNLLADPAARVEDTAEALLRAYCLLRSIPNAPPPAYRDLDQSIVDLASASCDPSPDTADGWVALWDSLHPTMGDFTFDGGGDDSVGVWVDPRDDGDLGQETTPSPPEPVSTATGVEATAAAAGPVVAGDGDVGTGLQLDEARASIEGEGEGSDADAPSQPEAIAARAQEDPVPGGAMDRLMCEGDAVPFVYPEWDERAGRYREGWCTLWERRLKGGSADYYHGALRTHRYLVRQVERRFELLRPDLLRWRRGLVDGDELDLDRVIDASVELRATGHIQDRVYQRRDRTDRSVSLLFLLDMSLSTSEGVLRLDPNKDDMGWSGFGRPEYKRIIDIEKESLVVLTRALEQVGDRYGVYGFSGSGRHGTRFYVIKDFAEALTAAPLARFETIAPVQSTRMGPAIRHAVKILGREPSRTRVLVIIGDGQPQDVGYGSDEGLGPVSGLSPSEQRQLEKDYALADTHKALAEARTAGLTPFILSIDRHGQDYLRAICGEVGYEVVQDVASLPRRLVTLYHLLAT
ncbi:MAG: hypothetical protein EXR51_01335 [Dehalococcoidia bacterium]|nr:hypothetical protein [Dehalococcoidia bacterium]